MHCRAQRDQAGSTTPKTCHLRFGSKYQILQIFETEQETRRRLSGEELNTFSTSTEVDDQQQYEGILQQLILVLPILSNMYHVKVTVFSYTG